MNGQTFTINSEFTLKAAQDQLAKQWNERKWLQISFNYDKTRSMKQNAALHVYCKMLSEALNDAGLDMKQVLAHHAEIPWDESAVKNKLWRPIQQAMIEEESTTKARTIDYPAIYETLNRYTASKLGVSVDWPSKEGRP